MFPLSAIYYDEKSCIFLGPKCLQFRGSPLNFAFFLWGILPASRAGGWMYFFKLECPKPFPSPLFVILGKKLERRGGGARIIIPEISQREHVFSIIPAEISLMGRNCQNEICWSKNWISASKT